MVPARSTATVRTFLTSREPMLAAAKMKPVVFSSSANARVASVSASTGTDPRAIAPSPAFLRKPLRFIDKSACISIVSTSLLPEIQPIEEYRSDRNCQWVVLGPLKKSHAFDVVRLGEHVHDRGAPYPIAASHQRDEVAHVR